MEKTLRQRPEVVGAVAVGLLALLLSLARTLVEPTWPTDFDQWYYAARAMWQGLNPYDAVGPTSAFRWNWPLYYPISTVLLAMPFTALALPVARVCFATIGGAVLGYALGKDHFRRLGLLFSAAFLIAVFRNQWSPYFTAAYFVPLAAVFVAAKPNMAVPFVAGIRDWRQFRWLAALGAVIGAGTLVVRPSWPMDWLGSLREMQHIVAPVMRPGGWLLALALLKWRRPEARMFLALVCVPQTPSLYDLLPLFVVTRTTREVSLLAFFTHALFFVIVVRGPFDAFNTYAYELGSLATFLIYLPVMVMLLRRPNVFRDPLDDTPPVRRPWREQVVALPRVDAVLLLINASMAALLVWLSVSTSRT